MTLRSDNGDTVTVRANRFLLKHARAYNLTVDGLHSYYVLAGDTPVLVHNSRCLIGNVVGPKGERHCGCPRAAKPSPPPMREAVGSTRSKRARP
ncbi:hypothetical protein ACWGOK_31745 [Streptomyces eurythermus]